MTNQIESEDGKPRKDGDRPSPDVEQAIDGQSNLRGTATFDQHGDPALKPDSLHPGDSGPTDDDAPGHPQLGEERA